MHWQFESWSDFLAMGGYGFYVWLAFSVSFIAILLLIIDSLKSKQNLFKQVLAESQRRARIKAARETQNTQVGEAQHES